MDQAMESDMYRHEAHGRGFFRTVRKAPGTIRELTVRQVGEVMLDVFSAGSSHMSILKT